MKTNPSSHSIEPLEPRIAPAVIFVVNDNNQLISFDSATPGTIIATKNITGLTNAVTETIKGIDFRPATGQLYALGLTVVPAPITTRAASTLSTRIQAWPPQ